MVSSSILDTPLSGLHATDEQVHDLDCAGTFRVNGMISSLPAGVGTAALARRAGPRLYTRRLYTRRLYTRRLCTRRPARFHRSGSGYPPHMPLGAQPPGRRGTLERPYSALNLRLILAAFGLLACTVLAILLFRAELIPLGWAMVALALTAVVDLVVIQRRRRARRRTGDQGRSLFE